MYNSVVLLDNSVVKLPIYDIDGNVYDNQQDHDIFKIFIVMQPSLAD
jgi:hypothetical protein